MRFLFFVITFSVFLQIPLGHSSARHPTRPSRRHISPLIPDSDGPNCRNAMRLRFAGIEPDPVNEIPTVSADNESVTLSHTESDSDATEITSADSVPHSQHTTTQSWWNGCERRFLGRISDCVANVTAAPDVLNPSIQSEQLRGKTTVSLGEGRAGTILFLRQLGIPAFGIDLNRPSPSGLDRGLESITPHVRHTRNHSGFDDIYLVGDATTFSTHPIVRDSNGGIDFIFSYGLICELDAADIIKTLVESAKSLRTGGEARFAAYMHGSAGRNRDEQAEILRATKQQLNSLNLNVAIGSYQITHDYNDAYITWQILLKKFDPSVHLNVSASCAH